MMKLKRSQGFTLLEVMIALFVLSVGMLGSTAMMLRGQTEATKINYSSTATQMASAMAEMMRSNITGVDAGAYNALDSSVADPGCIASGCTAENIAAYDGYLWGWMLNQYLPNGRGDVSGNGADSVFTISIEWTETQRTGNDTGIEVTQNYTMKFQP
jgi:type IV pilus assembly protein PilV